MLILATAAILLTAEFFEYIYIHELGHQIAFSSYGCKSKIIFDWGNNGRIAHVEAMPHCNLSMVKKFFVLIMGPTTGMLFYLFVSFGFLLIKRSRFNSTKDTNTLLKSLLLVSIFLFIFDFFYYFIFMQGDMETVYLILI